MKTLKKMAVSLGTMIIALPALAEEVVAVTTGAGGSQMGLIAIGAGLGMGLAAIGGAAGQGKAASSALDGIARNPSSADKMFVPLLLSLALMESLVIFTFLVTKSLADKV